jgi:iron complex transport system substrate-binding protein
MRYLIILLLFFIACQTKQVEQLDEGLSHTEDAMFFSLHERQDTLYLKVKSSQSNNRNLLDLKIVAGRVQRPNGEFHSLDKCLLISSSQLGAFKVLDRLDKIKGFNNKAYAYDSTVRKRMDENEILTIGEIASFNKERILQIKPDAIFYSAEVNGSSEFKFFENQGILMIPVLEWQEGSALARAEWIKFYGALLGNMEIADSIYSVVKKEYRKHMFSYKNPPQVMVGNDYQGVWYTPAGESYVSKMIFDAGGEYAFSSSKGKGSLSKDFEVMIHKCAGSDYWLNPGTAASLIQLKSENPLYMRFKPFKRRQVFNCVGRAREDGANDYWEVGVFRPDLVLEDYKKIFKGQHDSLFYYKRLP